MNVGPLESLKKHISYFNESFNDLPRIFFDSSSFTLISDDVLKAVSDFYKSGGARPTTGLYPGTSVASTTIESCRRELKDFFSATAGEIAFPASRGIGLLDILYSLSLTASLELFVYTGLDHDSWLPAFEFAHQRNISFHAISVQNTESELLTDIERSLQEFTEMKRVLVVPLRSLGNGLSLSKEFFQKITSKQDVITILDCSFAVGVSEINFSDLTIDFAVFDSNIGLGGPIGSGIMYIKDTFIELMKPFVFLGNGSISKVTASSYGLEDMPHRLESSIDPSVMAGLQVAIRNLNKISLTTVSNHINSLKNYFLDLTKTIKGLTLTGNYSQNNFTNIIGLVIPEVNMHEVAMYLDEVCQIDVRTGSFCAHQLIDQLYANLGLEHSNLGILQVSFHYYNTENDIVKLFDGIKEFYSLIS